jgi:hypothetical protein
VSENRALKRIFGSKKHEVTGGLRKVHNEKLRNCTLLQVQLEHQIKEDAMGGTCNMNGEKTEVGG